MTAWIFQTNPTRYDLLERATTSTSEETWAMNQHRKVVAIGDSIYFYVSGSNAGIYVKGHVSSPLDELQNNDSFGRWKVGVTFEALIEPPVTRNELLEDTVLSGVQVFTRSQGTNFIVTDEEALNIELLISDRLRPLKSNDSLLQPHEINEAILDSSVPDRVTRSIMQRRGQKSFRDKLLTAYGGRCAVTGDGPLDVLEAAHIEPYATSGLNHHTNGLLLRADIHTLFDLDLIRINPDTLRVETTAGLNGTSYSSLAGTELRKRLDGQAPNDDLLRKRYQSSSSI
jgi:hypothetical protein